MPELPEVETMRRGILGAVGGRITAVEKPPCGCKPIQLSPPVAKFRARAVGRRIDSIDRAGKRVVVRLDNDLAIVFEPRMTGLVLVADPPGYEHLRFRLDVADAEVKRIWYWDRRGLGSVRMLSKRQFEAQLGADKLGPDALSVDWETLRDRLHESRRAIKVALLDQRAIAGIGNLYASEILHVARVHPESPCDRLSRAQWARIQQSIGETLNTAIRYEGSTLSDGTYRNALNQSGGYQIHHRVYDREGQRCATCRRGIVRRFVQAQRSTFYCPLCQRNSRRNGASRAR